MKGKTIIATASALVLSTFGMFAQGAEASSNHGSWLFITLLTITGVLTVLTLSRTAKIYEMIGEIKGSEKKLNWNRINGILMVFYMFIFLGGTIWEMYFHGNMLLPESASEHGKLTDNLFNITFWITVVVFVITHILLFWFTYKYRGKEGNRGYFYPVNDKLEIIWTAIPAVVLSVLVISGLKTWGGIMNGSDTPKMDVEVYAYQFNWLTRYPGADGTFGNANYNLVSASNGVGLITDKDLEAKIEEIEKAVATQKARLVVEEAKLAALFSVDPMYKEKKEVIDADIATVKETLENKEKHLERLINFPNSLKSAEAINIAKDDIVLNELVLPVNTSVRLNFRARDVLHSAYMPHFRLQMNCVPGMPTYFTFTPTITTKEMKEKLENPNFEYVMLCAKICGVSHFNMQMKVTIVTQEEYEQWLSEQKPYYTAQYPVADVSNNAVLSSNN